MARGVEIEWHSKDEATVRSLDRITANMDNLARKMDKVEVSSRRAVQTTVSGLDAANTKVSAFVQGFIGVGAVVAGIQQSAQALKAEWENLKRQQQAALDKNVALADVLPSTYRQAGGLLTAKEIETAVKGGSKSTGVGEVKVAQAIGEALAARGATNKQEAQGAIDAAVAALKFAPESDAGTIAALAGGTTDIQRRFGVSPEQSIGFLARVGGQARVTSLREQVQNLNPAIGGLASYGASPQEAGALVSVMTGATGDFTGAVSATASLALAKQLQDRGFASPGAGIAALQADPKLREAFLKGGRFGKEKFAGASFETRALPAITELLTGGSALAQNYEAAKREVGTFAQGGATYSEMISEVGNFESVRLANLLRNTETASGGFLLGQTLDARTAASRKVLEEALGNVNFIGPDAAVRAGRSIAFETGAIQGNTEPELFAAQILRDTAKVDPNGRNFLGANQDVEREYLRQQANKLDQIYLELKKQNDSPRPVEVVNEGGPPAVNRNAAQGFGR